MLNNRRLTRVLLYSVSLSAMVLVAGCMVGPPTPISWLLECHGPNCEYSPGPWIRSWTAQMSADGSEITVPFDCRPPGKTRNEKRAIAYTVATGEWRAVPYPNIPTGGSSKNMECLFPGKHCVIRSCADAACSKVAYLGRVDPKHPAHSSEKFYEVFYSENGRVRQLTNFDDHNIYYADLRLSADAHKLLVDVSIGRDGLTLVDVESGAVTSIPYWDRAWKECVGPNDVGPSQIPANK